MAEDSLVTEDVEAAARLVRFLDTYGFPVKAALWLYVSDAARWRFMIALREKRESPTSFYKDIAKAIHKAGSGDQLLDLSRVDLVDPESSVVGPLARAIRVEGDSRVRLTSNTVNGVFLEDALIYRLAG